MTTLYLWDTSEKVSGHDVKSKSTTFKPLCETTQVKMAAALGLKVEEKHKCPPVGAEIGFPSFVTEVMGDGNCFFRAISLALTGITGYHAHLRYLMVKNVMEQRSYVFEPQIDPQYNNIIDYFNGTKVTKPGTWVSELEIMMMADYLCLPIIVNTAYGTQRDWLKYTSPVMDKDCGFNQAIYLTHVGANHFNYVNTIQKPGSSSPLMKLLLLSYF